MGFLDTLKQAAGDVADQEPHAAFDNVLQQTPLGGLSGLLDHLHEGGLGDAVAAWEGGGDHPPIDADQIKAALGDEHLQQVASALGVSPAEAAAHLAEHLPDLAAAHAGAEDHDDSGSAATGSGDADAETDEETHEETADA